MRVFPEPALCADDACRLVPGNGSVGDEAAVRWLKPVRAARRRRSLPRLVASVAVFGLAVVGTLPDDSLAPPAAAHDRIDLRPARSPSAPSALSPEWRGVALAVEKPSTAELIQTDLDRLSSEAGEDDLLSFGMTRVPRSLVETILRAARDTEVDPVYLMALADKESSFLPHARAATSTAEGLFQFLTGTWLELLRAYGPRHGLAQEAGLIQRRGGSLVVADPAARRRILALRRDPYIAGLMAGEMMKRDRARVAQRVGRDLTHSECYFAHLLGAASASRFMQLTAEKPDHPAQAAFRAAAKANRSLFFERDGKKTRSLSVAEVYERLDGMIDRRLDRFQSAASLADRIDTRRPDEAPPAAILMMP